MKTIQKLWIGIGILIILSPLGLLLPDYFKAGDAWGEWGVDAISGLVGYVPQGLQRIAQLWRAPFPDYAFSGWEEQGLGHLSLAYIFSAVVGIIVTVVVILGFGKLLSKKE
ncbi:MAG: PDGLE domain-containing protein [Candidatus Omnitrophica bacterium]|nr:PDGLE domain-containing protein [Candidatus Omnitrophota bacterium]